MLHRSKLGKKTEENYLSWPTDLLPWWPWLLHYTTRSAVAAGAPSPPPPRRAKTELCSHTVYSGIELWFRGKNVSFLWLFQDCKSCLGFNMSHYCKFFDDFFGNDWLHGLRTRKLPSLHNWKSTPNPKCLGTAKAYSISHIGPNFQIWALNWVSVVRYWLHII